MRVACALVTALLVGCSSDSNGPDDGAFPSVAGNYTVGATFDGVTTAVARGSGTLTLVQPNNGATLTGTADMTLRLNGQDFAVLGVSQGSVTEAGVVSFAIGTGSSPRASPAPSTAPPSADVTSSRPRRGRPTGRAARRAPADPGHGIRDAGHVATLRDALAR